MVDYRDQRIAVSAVQSQTCLAGHRSSCWLLGRNQKLLWIAGLKPEVAVDAGQKLEIAVVAW
jgi:hypothetical protein